MNHGLLLAAILCVFLVNHNPSSGLCDSDHVIIEDFQGSLFPAWLIREASIKQASRIYAIKSVSGRRYLHARSNNDSVQIAKKVYWDLKRYPVLQWQWRVEELPTGGNERYASTNDSAAGIYVIFLRNKVPGVSPLYQPINVIKYVWSTTLPIHTRIKKTKTKLGLTIMDARFLVLQSGSRKLNQWVTERRNILQDYRRLFGEQPGSNPVLIGILTDSNDTKSRARAGYGPLGLHRI